MRVTRIFETAVIGIYDSGSSCGIAIVAPWFERGTVMDYIHSMETECRYDEISYEKQMQWVSPTRRADA